MTTRYICLALLGLVLTASAAETKDYPHKPVPFTDVKLTDTFWQSRIETNRTVTIPFAFEQSEKTGRIENFKVAGGLSDKPWTGGFGFNDSDVNKILEGAAYCLTVKKDPKLEKYVDDLISWYAAAQEEDGFLYTWWTAGKRTGKYPRAGCTPQVKGKSGGRWSNLSAAHQLYNVGHMYEAGVAHYLATGKRTLLDVCIKNADLVCKEFGPNGIKEVPGHQEIEIGLVKLYRVTGDKKYLDQAKLFLHRRGRHVRKHPKNLYNQNHKPVVEQDEAVGHVVRANYMYTAMTDIAAITGDKDYLTAIDKLWNNVVGKKMYVTGGTGSTSRGEAYAENYALGNKSYCETCAAISVVYWSHRMFLLHGDAGYIDVMERSLYNNVLSGLGLDGKHFFYPNPLIVSKHGKERKKWFGVACCPSNLSRFIASVGGYMYAVRDNAAYVNIYGQSEAKIKLADRTIALKQETEYPWKGHVKITVNPDKAGKFPLKLRIPGWARNQPIPSDLYTVLPSDKIDWKFSCKVNGSVATVTTDANYAVLTRDWKAGDTIEVDWPMPPHRLISHEAVTSNKGLVALQRGPIVYCLESIDGGHHKHKYALADSAKLEAEHRADFLNGLTVIKMPGGAFAIPYYARSHRKRCGMQVWIKRK
jgi:DUF1680 family protein